MGFMVNVAGSVNGMPRSYYGTENFGNTSEKWNYMAVQNMAEYYGQDIFLTEALTREALKTLDEPVRRGQPFYLYMAHYATHTPISKDPRFFDRYKKEMGLDAGQSKFSSMVEGVDKSLGDVLDYLEAHHIADNTIIIFMSDNGGNADVKSKGGVPHTQNAPLREGKGSCYQGGIRVPMMVCWPGRTAPGTRIDTPVVPEDLFPTILEMGHVKKYTTSQEVDGKSLVKLLAGKPSDIDPQRPLFFHYPHQWKWEYKSEVDFLSTVIVGDWKLVYVMMNTVPGQRVQDGVPFELYNLREDIGETRNLAAEYPEKVAELARLLGERLRGWNAPMPIVRATGKPVPWPDELLK
jgi:arylsulfatase A-like enzyme